MSPRKKMNAAWWVIVAVSLAIGAVAFNARFHECRAHGFSVFYCATSR